jgi:hypothetical protein
MLAEFGMEARKRESKKLGFSVVLCALYFGLWFLVFNH